MNRAEVDNLISSLDSKRPLKVVRLSNKDLASIQWKPCGEGWEHLMSIPNGNVYKTRHEDYVDKVTGTKHRGLHGIFHKLLSMGLISRKEQYKFF